MSFNDTCKAETEGHCSFECVNCCYSSKEGYKHFKELYNKNLNIK